MRGHGDRRNARADSVATSSGPAVFDPASIATAWYRADDSRNAAAALASNGEKVASCINRANSGTHDLSQGTDANRPTMVASGLNGLPAWSFSATNYLQADTLAAIASGDDMPFTIFIVAKHLSDANTESAMVAFGNSGSTTPFLACKYRSDAANRQAEYQRRDDASSLVARQSSDVFATGNYLYEFFVDPAAMEILVNGVSVSGPHDNTAAGVTTLSTFSIGALRRNTVVFPTSSTEISEVLVANSALSSANRAQYRAYVLSRYGI